MTDTPPADDPVPEPAPPAGRPPGRTVRVGCMVLAVLGALGLFFGFSLVSDPDGARCTQARAILEDEEAVEDADDLDCDDALAQAAELDAADPDDDVAEVLSESAARTQGWLFGVIAAVQVVGAVLTMRTHAKRARLVALVGAGLGILFPAVGLLAILPLGFVVYAIFFSADARAVFGDPGGPRLFRPRTG